MYYKECLLFNTKNSRCIAPRAFISIWEKWQNVLGNKYMVHCQHDCTVTLKTSASRLFMYYTWYHNKETPIYFPLRCSGDNETHMTKKLWTLHAVRTFVFKTYKHAMQWKNYNLGTFSFVCTFGLTREGYFSGQEFQKSIKLYEQNPSVNVLVLLYTYWFTGGLFERFKHI